VLQEALGGIRDVLLDGTQQLYCNIYRQANQPLRRAQGNNAFIGGSPRFAVEALAIAVIAVLTYALSQRQGGITSALPTLGAIALGAQRLLPALQNCYAAWASIVGNQGSLSEMIDLLDQPVPEEMLQPPPAPLPFKQSIRLDAVSYRYEKEGVFVVSDLSITIPKGARVGFVGHTGSGKSTTLDLIMGLLTPTRGQILVDGRPIEGVNRRAWQRNIAHVPQSIFLADASLAENIAFGVPPEEFDMERVRQAARRAQIAEFIEGLPDGYQTRVGERGARLSGGQRQRIGIARALYKRASVLAFDEATSALDNPTEREVMDAIANLDRELTVLLIAHRLTTVRNCDIIFEFEQGRLAAEGSYEQLRATSPSFREIERTA
jgi:ATP-binding cassette subfamily B protein